MAVGTATASNLEIQRSDNMLGSPDVMKSLSWIFTWLFGFLPSWLMGWLRWCPTSPEDLAAAESKILSYVKQSYFSQFFEIGPGWGRENSYIRTIIMNVEGGQGKLPLVLLHGFGSGVGLWALNLDSLCMKRTVYGFDILGFGRSSRPVFSRDALEAEYQFVQSIESWRERVGLERFILLGHSMGGFLATAYALHHPKRVAHLILADPWGFPERPESISHHYQLPAWVKIIGAVMHPFNPLAGLRVAGPWGPKLVEKIRPDLGKKFSTLIEDSDAVSNYIYHCNAQRPSGESAFKAMSARYGWAKFPMINRITELSPEIPLTFVYGSRSWIDRQPGYQLVHLRPDSYIDVQIISGAGHHVYADKVDNFNSIVNKVCDNAEVLEEEIKEAKQARQRKHSRIGDAAAINNRETDEIPEKPSFIDPMM